MVQWGRTILMFIVIFGFSQTINLFSQTLPIITNSRGDTITYTWPIPIDSLCNKSEIIIGFKPAALKLNNLCWDLPAPASTETLIYNEYLSQYHSFLYSQEIPIDTLISDSTLSNAIKSFGGIYFQRISTASPCRDTFSLTRYGDTIFNRTYLLLKLKLNNDSTIINACTYLTYLFRNFLKFVEPNYCAKNNGEPNDEFFKVEGYDIDGYGPYFQQGLHSEYMDVERAWDYQKGNPNIKVAVVDNGIYCDHNDIGEEKVPLNYRYNYRLNTKDIDNGSTHGTMMASIIGAKTNNVFPFTPAGWNHSIDFHGMAGIAGGWNTTSSDVGCTLVGLKADNEQLQYSSDHVASAIIAAATDALNSQKIQGVLPQGYAVDVINCSWGFREEEAFPLTLFEAINYAYENGVSIVCARGNRYSTNQLNEYPATFEPNWVTSVGALTEDHENSNYLFGKNMDFLAPGDLNLITAAVKTQNTWTFIHMTSPAAAHVSGAVALLRSEFYEHPNLCNEKPEPEDFENMLKATCQDLTYDPDNINPDKRTKTGYDQISGWGEVKLGKLFEMLNEGYILKHYTIPWTSETIVQPIPSFLPYIPENIINVHVNNSTNPNSQIVDGNIILSGDYYALRRELKGKISIENEWEYDSETPLFVWGRSGRSGKGGFSQSSDLFLTHFTEVTSGFDEDNDGSGLGNGLAENLYHNIIDNKLEVTAKTYQLDLYGLDNSHKYMIPDNLEKIEWNITVFGKLRSLSVYSTESNRILYPNPAKDYFLIENSFSGNPNLQINVFDVLGNLVLSVFENQNSSNYTNIKVNIENLRTGFYFVEVKDSDRISMYKLLVQK